MSGIGAFPTLKAPRPKDRTQSQGVVVRAWFTENARCLPQQAFYRFRYENYMSGD